MLWKKLAILAATGAALSAAAPAFADRDNHRGHQFRPSNGWHANHHFRHHYRGPAYVVAQPRPHYYDARTYYYAPPRPVVVYREPVYVAPRPAVVYSRPGLSVTFGF